MRKSRNSTIYLTGKTFKLGLFAAASKLLEHYEHLNKINVFPVADGDTGSNMASTMRAIVEGIKQDVDTSLDSLSRIIAESALIGARGNSGIILAQFFHGLTQGITEAARVGPREFARAAIMAKERAYESLTHPQEGTILTVIADWAEHIWSHAHRYNDFEELMQDSLHKAKQSLKQTTDKLKSLQKANVVDAGAQGFVYLLDGVVELIATGRLKSKLVRKGCSQIKDREQEEKKTDIQPSSRGPVIQNQELQYRFCTEALLKGKDLDKEKIRKSISTLGDSLIVAGNQRTARVHIHTNYPEKVFTILTNIAALAEQKTEDMTVQHQHILDSQKFGVGIVTDSTCDIPPELMSRFDIQFAPLSLFLDEKEYIDKTEMGADEFARRLPRARTFRTSQPAPIRFKKTFAKSLTGYRTLISIHLSGGLSGTYLGAKQMSSQFQDRVQVINSKTLSTGLGLITLEAAQLAQQGMSREEIAEHVQEYCKKTRFFVALDTLDYAVRGGRVSRGMGILAKVFNVKPVITFDQQEGKVCRVGKAIGQKKVLQKMLDLLEEGLEGTKEPKFAIAHVKAPERAQHYASAIKKRFGVDPLYITPASPVLGIYSGLGAVGVAMLCL